MKLMLLDTSADCVAVGLYDGSTVISEEYANAERRYNSVIIGMMQNAFAKAGLKPSDIDGYGAVMGPGTFTGVRVGIAVAKAMCRATGASFYGASSLKILAEASGATGNVMPVLDARRGDVYFAQYEISREAIREIKEPDMASKEEYFSLIKGQDFVTCGIERDRNIFLDEKRMIFVSHISMSAFASVIRKGGAKMGLYDSSAVYVRKPDAAVKKP